MSSMTNQTDNQAKAQEADPRDFKNQLDKASEQTIKSANTDPQPTGGVLETGASISIPKDYDCRNSALTQNEK